MDEYEVRDRQFAALTLGNARLERLFTGTRWAEGPVYFRDAGHLLWSDIPNSRMLRWTADDGHVNVFRSPSHLANGNTRDREGRLVTCEHGARRVTRTELDGTVTVLADRFDEKRLNSPNDVVVRSDGSVWFSDPPYGIISDYEGHRAAMEQAGCYVYRLDPAGGGLSVVADDLVRPNGLAFSTDETVLYVSDTSLSHDPAGHHHIRAFDVHNGNSLANSRLVLETDVGFPDGFRVDEDDRLWTSAGDGVHCYSPDGALLGKIRIPETVANLTFGGPDRNRLFITAFSSLYAVYVNVRGDQRP